MDDPLQDLMRDAIEEGPHGLVTKLCLETPLQQSEVSNWKHRRRTLPSEKLWSMLLWLQQSELIHLEIRA